MIFLQWMDRVKLDLIVISENNRENMELKVWVDGIKRVVCGVTDNTTCQDIVIALAQAMGRTGRFTLMEIWRDNERPLPPTECPLIVLQKWGEFASEVKLVLYESGSRRRQKNSEKEKETKKPPDRFTYNFTPPVKTSDAVIKRSLTFSGGKRNDAGISNLYTKPDHSDTQQRLGNHGAPGKTDPNQHLLRIPERVISDGNSFSSNSSLSSQNSNAIHSQHRRQRSLSRERHNQVPNSGPASLPNYNFENRDRQQTYTNQPQNHPQNHHHKHHSPNPSQHHQQHQQHPHHQQHQQHPHHQQQHHQHLHHQQHQQQHHPQYPHSYKHPPPSGHHDNQATNHYPQPSTRPHFPIHEPNVPLYNVPVKPVSPRSSGHGSNVPQYSSAFSPVLPRSGGPDSERLNPSKVHNSLDIPVYTDVKPSSHKAHHLEEYDLDSNFPDVVKETGRDHLIEEYHVPGQGHHHSNHYSWEEEERVKLLRLVTMQNERIKMQDSQLEIIESEIISREQKHEDLINKISKIKEEISNLSMESESKDAELVKLDNDNLIGEMEAEKHAGREIAEKINAFKANLDKCEKELHQYQSKVKQCGETLEKEKEISKTDEKRRKEGELKIQNEITDIKKELNERSKDIEEKSKASSVVESELKEIVDELDKKTDELTNTEKELQRENLKFFQSPQTTELVSGSKGDTSGEAVLKVLEGSGTSTHVKRSKLLQSPLTILELTKSKNGVWV